MGPAWRGAGGPQDALGFRAPGTSMPAAPGGGPSPLAALFGQGRGAAMQGPGSGAGTPQGPGLQGPALAAALARLRESDAALAARVWDLAARGALCAGLHTAGAHTGRFGEPYFAGPSFRGSAGADSNASDDTMFGGERPQPASPHTPGGRCLGWGSVGGGGDPGEPPGAPRKVRVWQGPRPSGGLAPRRLVFGDAAGFPGLSVAVQHAE